MKLSWFNTSMGTHKICLAYEYVLYKAMQDIREIELRYGRSNANNKICFEVRATALRPLLHTEGFPLHPHRTSHKVNLHREICNYKLGVHNSSLQHNYLYTRSKAQSQNSITSTQKGIGTKPNYNRLYTRGIKAQSQTPPQSPLLKRDKAQTKPQSQSPLHKRDGHKAKAKKDYNSWWSQ